jgi:DNA-binding IclR family transcriptional regulator
MTAAATDPYRVQVLERSFNMIDALAGDHSELSLPELAECLQLHRSTVHRLLMVLEGRRYVERNPASGKYRLGWKFLELGSVAAARLDAAVRARPHLEELVRATGETAHMGVLREGAVVSVANVESSRSLHTPSTVGRRSPAHCSSLGKCLLAQLPPLELERFVGSYPLKAYTANTITSLDRLKPELRRVRQRGYAVDQQEAEVGLKCIGAPVRDHSGKVIAAVSIAGPAARLDRSRMPALATAVMKAAAALSASLGYQRESAGPPSRA